MGTVSSHESKAIAGREPTSGARTTHSDTVTGVFGLIHSSADPRAEAAHAGVNDGQHGGLAVSNLCAADDASRDHDTRAGASAGNYESLACQPPARAGRSRAKCRDATHAELTRSPRETLEHWPGGVGPDSPVGQRTSACAERSDAGPYPEGRCGRTGGADQPARHCSHLRGRACLNAAGPDLVSTEGLHLLLTVRLVDFVLGDGRPARSVTRDSSRAARILSALGITELDPPAPPTPGATVVS